MMNAPNNDVHGEQDVQETALPPPFPQNMADSEGAVRVEPQIQMIAIAIEQRYYGIKAGSVREILKVPKISWVPWAPPFVIGVMTLRGEIQAVMDLKFFLHGTWSQISQHSRIILAESRELMAGFLVDDMLDIINVPVRKFLPITDSDNMAEQRYIEGQIPWNDVILAVLDLDTLLQSVVVNQG